MVNNEDFFDKKKRDAILVNLNNSIKYLDKLYEQKEGQLISNFPTINGVIITFSKQERFFKFSSQAFAQNKLNVEPYLYQNEAYGYSSFFLKLRIVKAYLLSAIPTLEFSTLIEAQIVAQCLHRLLQNWHTP